MRIRKSWMALMVVALAALGEAGIGAGGRAGRLTLVPIDDRPAVGQFAQMIGAIADREVTMPPRPMLGNFTKPGETAGIERWLRERDYRGTEALIISVDMLAYGGLVASRRYGVDLEEAQRRLQFFRWFRARYPKIPVYAFSVIMRVAPTASAATEGLHDRLARFAELKDRVPRTGDAALARELEELERGLAPEVIGDYLAARRRDLQINLAMIDLVREGLIDELILLQDDARQYGLHRQDQSVLRARLKELGLERRIPIYNGTDEGALSLVSRAILDRRRVRLRVGVVFSSEKSREVVTPYEDHPLQFTVENQIRAASGVPVGEGEKADYRLFINAPGTTDAEFEQFLRKMIGELERGEAVALADLNFPPPHRSGADLRIIERLAQARLLDRFVGYAAWNTAGNTLGTTIPFANLRIADRKWGIGGGRAGTARREAAHLEFLLNRYAGDYIYHDIVRQEINDRLREESKRTGAVNYELSPERHARVDAEVRAKMVPLIEKFFADNFVGRRYRLDGAKSLVTKGLRDLRIHLPWARTFECEIDFRIDYAEVSR
jgi:hypothetical protein